MNEELNKEMKALLDKYGVDMQIRQIIAFVPKKHMGEEIVETPEVAEESAPEEVAE